MGVATHTWRVIDRRFKIMWERGGTGWRVRTGIERNQGEMEIKISARKKVE